MEKIETVLSWIQELNKTTTVEIKKCKLSDSDFWFFDETNGHIHNRNNSFFSVAGIRGNIQGEYIEQPILLQDEIGYLGILCKDFDGITHYLMQAKIEPGNINCIQISPTIQATKSNFTQKHGGAKPLYLDYFLNAEEYDIVCDQIQSEQSARFYAKRNRNIVIKLPQELDVVVEKRFKWMTLRQIKELMKYENLVNMDTRTVISCLPLLKNDFDTSIYDLKSKNRALFDSILYQGVNEEIVEIYHDINNYKMFENDKVSIIRLDELKNWNINDNELVCKDCFPYKVIFCNIEIEGREVRNWNQPLFQANGIALFGLFMTKIDGITKFLVRIKPEIGCFDKVEIGTTIQKEAGFIEASDCIEEKFLKILDENKELVVFDSILSEEGGRFYHEENRNVIIEVDASELDTLPKGYHLVSYATLNYLNLINNCLNIQLRNLMATLEV